MPSLNFQSIKISKTKLSLYSASLVIILTQLLLTFYLLNNTEIMPIVAVIIGLIPFTGYLLFIKTILNNKKNNPPSLPIKTNQTTAQWSILPLVFIFMGVLIILFHRTLFLGEGLFPADGIFAYWPWKGEFDEKISNWLLADQYKILHPWHHWFSNLFQEGKFPLWNPYICCGVPATASLQAAAFFPINMLLIFLDPFFSMSFASFLEVLFSGWFMMLYLRQLGVSRSGTFISAVSFALCSFMIVWRGHPHVNSAMCLPLLLYFIERQFNAKQQIRLWLPGISLTYGVMLLGGHPPTMIHVSIITIVYFFYKILSVPNEGKLISRILWLLCGFGLGILIASPQLLSFLEYHNLSSSALSSQSMNRVAHKLNFPSLIQLFFPYIGGSPHLGFEKAAKVFNFLNNFNERTIFTGIIPLFLAIIAILYKRNKLTYFWTTIIAVSFFIIFAIPPFPVLLKETPLLNLTSNIRFILFICFGIATLSGIGFDLLSEIKQNNRWKILLIFWWIGILIISWWIIKTALPAITHYEIPYKKLIGQQFLITFSSMIIITITVYYKTMSKWIKALVLIGVTIEMIWFAIEYNPSIERKYYYPETKAISFLKKDPSLFRFFAKDSIFPPNVGQVYNLYDIRGQDFMTVKRYEELIRGQAGYFWFFSSKAQIIFPSIHHLNVKYIMTRKHKKLPSSDFTKVYDDEVAIYQFNSFKERALLVYNYKVETDINQLLAKVRLQEFNPSEILLLEEEPIIVLPSNQNIPADQSKVTISKYDTDEVIIDVLSAKPGFLLLMDTWFPGWDAYLNGKKTKIYRANYNFRAVAVPSGKSTIRFHYKPRSFWLGVSLTLTALFILLLITITKKSFLNFK